ncbi:MAG: hypothetical protein QW474_01560 [Candidatus Aenigmatarchaeota archaeon]
MIYCCSSEIKITLVQGMGDLYANLSVPDRELGRRDYIASNGQEISCLDGLYRVKIVESKGNLKAELVKI